MELNASPAQLTIVLADNGHGFEYRPGLNGNGLSNLHERLEAIGGRCEIVSQPEAGTRVSLVLPLNSSDLQQL
jgi:signal transduction histidine kinase